jgi:enoyl-[acyl-carrier protein] reductase I
MDLSGKKGLVLGVANKRSLAWAIAQRAAAAGADLALTYQGERLEENVRELAGTLDRESLILPCDVSADDQIDALFPSIADAFGRLDFVVHGAAFAPREALSAPFVETTREAFRVSLDVSAYSLVALARGARPLMLPNGGSILTLTYLGAERVFPNYNVMGVAKAALECAVRYLASDLGGDNIRVNAISAGPVKTLAATGIAGFSGILQVYRDRSPLKRNIEGGEVGDTGLFLLSDLARAITGEVLHVDAGYHIVGL